MDKENLSSLGAVVSSLLAASCCVGPAVFVLFGTSAGFLGRLAVLEPLRPYFLAAAGVMFGYSFWKLYLWRPKCDCQGDRRSRWLARLIFWLGLALFVGALFFQKLVLWLAF